jgi:hypothetical protein
MQEVKYYQPDISEFRVGFEFESNYVLFQKPNEEWSKCTFSTDNLWFWDSYGHDAYKNEFRVKYLDKEDIESLEFKQEGKIYKDKRGNSVELTGYPNYDCRITLVYCSRKFEGKIKNKSEFKRILKQLGL